VVGCNAARVFSLTCANELVGLNGGVFTKVCGLGGTFVIGSEKGNLTQSELDHVGIKLMYWLIHLTHSLTK
jgi:hypothetical protein